MRVLVTRAVADAERTAAALVRLGNIEAIVAPVIVIVPTSISPPRVRPAAMIATSNHAFAAPLHGLDTTRPCFVVGLRTAAAARDAGFKDVRIGSGGGTALLPLIALTLPRPARLLYLAGRDRKPDIETGLVAAGYGLDVVEAYAAEAAAAWPDVAVAALRQVTVTAALHYSRRSAELALSLARHHVVDEPFLALRHLCVSGDAAEPLRAAGAASVAWAASPDEGALLALLQTARDP